MTSGSFLLGQSLYKWVLSFPEYFDNPSHPQHKSEAAGLLYGLFRQRKENHVGAIHSQQFRFVLVNGKGHIFELPGRLGWQSCQKCASDWERVRGIGTIWSSDCQVGLPDCVCCNSCNGLEFHLLYLCLGSNVLRRETL
jgi:hypothetical protein